MSTVSSILAMTLALGIPYGSYVPIGGSVAQAPEAVVHVQRGDPPRVVGHEPQTMAIPAEQVVVLDVPTPPPQPRMRAELRFEVIVPSVSSVGVAASSPTPSAAPAPSGPVAGVWIGSAEIAQRPMSGAGWDSIVGAARHATPDGANLADMNSNHDSATLAAALVAVRTGRAEDRQRAMAALEGAIGTQAGARWLAVGRNLGGYVIAADLLDVRSGPVRDWLASFLTRPLSHNNDSRLVTLHDTAWNSGSNASAQEGFVHAALAAYLGNAGELAWGWNGFRRYAGDRSSPHRLSSNDDSWQLRPSDPVGIQDAGARRDGCRLDGAIGNDMSRGGAFSCEPGMTDYPWVGLMGAVPAAVVYARAGYPAWTVADSALMRAADYLHQLSRQADAGWYDAGRAAQAKHLLNVAYGLGYPAGLPTGIGQTVGFTDWTHPDPRSVNR
jgi:hypothetical protein